MLSAKITNQRKLNVVSDFPYVFHLNKVSGDEALSKVRIGRNRRDFLNGLAIGHDEIFDERIWSRGKWSGIKDSIWWVPTIPLNSNAFIDQISGVNVLVDCVDVLVDGEMLGMGLFLEYSDFSLEMCFLLLVQILAQLLSVRKLGLNSHSRIQGHFWDIKA